MNVFAFAWTVSGVAVRVAVIINFCACFVLLFSSAIFISPTTYQVIILFICQFAIYTIKYDKVRKVMFNDDATTKSCKSAKIQNNNWLERYIMLYSHQVL